MKSLYQILESAQKDGVAVGHFNISDIVALRAIFKSARGLNLPVMIGVSEGERDFIGVRQAAALVKSLREEFNYPIFLNADHTHSVEKAVEAAEAGFDEILIDGSKLPFLQNVSFTKQAVEAVRAVNPNIVIEGEIGYIGSSSEIVSEVPPESLNLTTPEEAKKFVDETGIDVLAPAVGNMHGLLAEMVEGKTRKHLNIERIVEIKEATGIFLTLHGGSGTDDADFQAAIKTGITVVHVNSEIRLAWRRATEHALLSYPKEIAPYKILAGAVEAISDVVEARLKLFNFIGG